MCVIMDVVCVCLRMEEMRMCVFMNVALLFSLVRNKDVHCSEYVLCLSAPFRDEDARSHLRCMRNTDGCVEPGEACYIIYQDLLEFDYLHALCVGGENPVLVTYDVRYTRPNTESGLIFHVKVDNETLTFRDPQELKFYLSNTLGLGTHIYPKGGYSVCVCVCVRVCLCV